MFNCVAHLSKIQQGLLRALHRTGFSPTTHTSDLHHVLYKCMPMCTLTSAILLSCPEKLKQELANFSAENQTVNISGLGLDPSVSQQLISAIV